ncbi:MAG: hypothetical protein DHS20C01_05310 [marine bacterium B5-7]|nr:MAG: hypothetical protein DHS20C01_05310 [marine bacterium B5-7]
MTFATYTERSLAHVLTPAVMADEIMASRWLESLVRGTPQPLMLKSNTTEQYGYFVVGSSQRIVAIAEHGGLDLPIGMAASTTIVRRVIQASRVTLGDNRLTFDGYQISIAKYRDDRPIFSISPKQAAVAALVMEDALNVAGHPFEPAVVNREVEVFGRALRGVSDVSVADAAGRLIGLGSGSTPSGDDVVSGAAATLAACTRANDPISVWARSVLAEICRTTVEAAKATTPLSAELLACAVQGYMLPRLIHCIRCAVNNKHIDEAMSELRLVGHSSGYFLASGAALALRAAATITNQENYHVKPY